ncbi:MAG: hypothetical protein WD378_00190, partial [Egicoccus sp.]
PGGSAPGVNPGGSAPGVNLDHLGDVCRARLARYKCPTRFEVVDSLPMTASGKVRRRELRADD